MSETAIQTQDTQQLSIPQRVENRTWYTPLVDIYETDESYVFQADLPGVKAEDLDISFENGVLTMEGRVGPRQPQGPNYMWREYGVGSFYRQFTLNALIDLDAVKAELKNGELTLTVPKAQSARPKKIKINA